MHLKEQVYWSAGLELPYLGQAPPPARVDVAVVGGGLTGLAAARELARRGVRVAVFEAQHVGWGASSRNGGQLLTGLKLDVATLTARYGAELAGRLFSASLAAIAYTEQVIEEDQIACDFRRCGHLFLAARPGHFEAMGHESELLRRQFGHETELLERGVLQDEVGSTAYYGGLLDRQSAGVQPAHYVAGLAWAAAQAGALIIERAAVEMVERGAGGFLLRTKYGITRAATLFVASGGYTGPATPQLRRKIFPLGSYVIVTAPLAERLAHELLPQERMAFNSQHLLHYFRLTPDRRLLFGGRAAFFPETPASVRRSAALLRRQMITIFPQLRGVAVEYAWGGTLDVAFDLMPHAGQYEGIGYALGYAGHGVALASYLGAQMAACMLGAAHDSVFAEIAFPGAPLGLYRGRPWFLPLAGAWYWLRDLIE